MDKKSYRRRRWVILAALFVFNMVCNAGIAFLAFGYIPATKGWSWDRASNTFWGLLGGVGGALVAIVLVVGITTMVVIVVNSENTRLKQTLGIVIIVSSVGVGAFGNHFLNGTALFFAIFAAVFAVETFVEQWLSQKLTNLRQKLAAAQQPQDVPPVPVPTPTPAAS